MVSWNQTPRDKNISKTKNDIQRRPFPPPHVGPRFTSAPAMSSKVTLEENKLFQVRGSADHLPKCLVTLTNTNMCSTPPQMEPASPSIDHNIDNYWLIMLIHPGHVIWGYHLFLLSPPWVRTTPFNMNQVWQTHYESNLAQKDMRLNIWKRV